MQDAGWLRVFWAARESNRNFSMSGFFEGTEIALANGLLETLDNDLSDILLMVPKVFKSNVGL